MTPPGSPNKRVQQKDLAVLCLAFFTLMSAYSSIQNLQSSVVPGKLGYWSLAAAYAGFCFCSLLVSSTATEILKPKYTLVLGSAAYTALLAANIYPRAYTLLPAAAINGIGAGLIWTAQGAYLTNTAVNYAKAIGQPVLSVMGLFNGIFICNVQMSQLVGNLLGSLILLFGGGDAATRILFYTLLAITLASVVMFLGLGKEPSERELEREGRLLLINDEEGGQDATSEPYGGLSFYKIGIKIVQVFVLLRDPRMYLLVLSMIYVGLEQAFTAADFTSDVIKKTMGMEYIGIVLCAFGGVGAVASFVVGKLSDRLGKMIFVIVGSLAHGTFFAFFLFLQLFSSIEWLHQHSYVLFIMSGILGLGDACWNTFVSVMMSSFFTDKTEPAFSNFRFWMALGFVMNFVWGSFLVDQYHIKCIILVNVMVLATTCVVILNFLVSPLDRDPHEVTTLEERPTIIISNNKNHHPRPRVIHFKE